MRVLRWIKVGKVSLRMVVGEGLFGAKAPHPAGRCLRQRALALLESNLNRRFSTFPDRQNIQGLSWMNVGETVLKDGGGGRIRTFEVDDGRFTVCSLWPLGNPTTGLLHCCDDARGKDYSEHCSSPFGSLPMATLSRWRSSRTLKSMTADLQSAPL